MKIMSFNTQHCLNFLENKIDYPLFAKTIAESGADVIGLNEMRDEGEREDFEPQMRILSELSGIENYYFARAIFHRGNNPYGNGLLSKYRIVEAETIPIPDPDPATRAEEGYYETRCILKARLENGLTVMVTHFGLNKDEQESAVKTVIENMEPQKCVLMGDFNVIPGDDILVPLRMRMKDTANTFTTPMLSFPSDKPDRKIDYIFATPDIELISADIPALVVSDHRPHTAEIKF